MALLPKYRKFDVLMKGSTPRRLVQSVFVGILSPFFLRLACPCLSSSSMRGNLSSIATSLHTHAATRVTVHRECFFVSLPPRPCPLIRVPSAIAPDGEGSMGPCHTYDIIQSTTFRVSLERKRHLDKEQNPQRSVKGVLIPDFATLIFSCRFSSRWSDSTFKAPASHLLPCPAPPLFPPPALLHLFYCSPKSLKRRRLSS